MVVLPSFGSVVGRFVGGLAVSQIVLPSVGRGGL